MSPTPRAQIDAVYGLKARDVDNFTASGGVADTFENNFRVRTSTAVGSFATIRSRRAGRYRPGSALRVEFTAMYPNAGVANSLQVAGPFTSEDALFVGYNGAEFGFTRRIPGRSAVWELTITAPEPGPGASTLSVTLDGVTTNVVIAGAATVQEIAAAIAAAPLPGFAAWRASGSPDAVGATVIFVQSTPATTGGAGTFTYSSTGSSTGSFAEITAGTPNDDQSGFVPQSEWNVNDCSGNGGERNPGGFALDRTKLNVWTLGIPYLGAGAIALFVHDENSRLQLVHVDEYPNANTIASSSNPTYRVGWVAASLGSTSALAVEGASAAVFLDGEETPLRDPFSADRLAVTVDTAANAVLVLKVRPEIAGRLCQREVRPVIVSIGNETSNRNLRVRLIKNPTFSSEPTFSYVDQDESAVVSSTPTGVTASGGELIATFVLGGSSSDSPNLSDLDLRLRAGDVLAFVASASASTLVATLGATWHEF